MPTVEQALRRKGLEPKTLNYGGMSRAGKDFIVKTGLVLRALFIRLQFLFFFLPSGGNQNYSPSPVEEEPSFATIFVLLSFFFHFSHLLSLPPPPPPPPFSLFPSTPPPPNFTSVPTHFVLLSSQIYFSFTIRLLTISHRKKTNKMNRT